MAGVRCLSSYFTLGRLRLGVEHDRCLSHTETVVAGGGSSESGGLAPTALVGQVDPGPNQQLWDAEADFLREVTQDIEGGWYEISDVPPTEARWESIAEIERRLDELEREYGDQDL